MLRLIVAELWAVFLRGFTLCILGILVLYKRFSEWGTGVRELCVVHKMERRQRC